MNLKSRRLSGRAGIKHTHASHRDEEGSWLHLRKRGLKAPDEVMGAVYMMVVTFNLHTNITVNIMYLIRLSQREFFIKRWCKYIKKHIKYNTCFQCVVNIYSLYQLTILSEKKQAKKKTKLLNNRHTFRRWRAHKHIQRGGSHSRPWFELGSGVRRKKKCI